MAISQKELYGGVFKDKRLDRRAALLSSLLYFGRSSSIHEITGSEAEEKAAYRFLANEKVKEDELIAAIKERSSYLCSDKDVLVLQDTTEINMDNHRNRIRPDTGLGPTGNNKDIGFFLHASLVLDGNEGTVLGFSDIQLWHREDKDGGPAADREAYKKLPIEEKESFKWIKACEAGALHLCRARTVTFVEDREGDIYEQFARVPDASTHLIVRNRDDRRLAGSGKLFGTLARQPLAGCYDIAIVQDIRKGVEKRTATVEARFCSIEISRPVKCRNAALPRSVALYAVEVRETAPPAGCKAVCWRLLTTHPVKSYMDAVRIVSAYRSRWHIEQLFRLLKERGFRIESSELETGWAIRKLTVMVANAALRVMQLMLAHDNSDSQPIGQVFDEKEIACMRAIAKTLEGDTEKSRNNHDPKLLCWATWVIARLGGWKNYNSKRPPGPIILKKGLDRFNNIYQGWSLAAPA